MLMRAAAALAVCMTVAGWADAQGLRETAELKARELTAQIQEHAAAAKMRSAEGARAVEGDDKAGACAGFKAGRVEAQTVLDLLTKQREQVMMASEDAGTALARVNKVDEMSGAWIGLASQLDQRIAAVC
jgi:hypothetical protein